MTEELIGCNGAFHRYRRAAARRKNLSSFKQFMCSGRRRRRRRRRGDVAHLGKLCTFEKKWNGNKG